MQAKISSRVVTIEKREKRLESVIVSLYEANDGCLSKGVCVLGLEISFKQEVG